MYHQHGYSALVSVAMLFSILQCLQLFIFPNWCPSYTVMFIANPLVFLSTGFFNLRCDDLIILSSVARCVNLFVAVMTRYKRKNDF